MSHLSEIYCTCICPAKQRAPGVVSQAIRQGEIVFNQHPSVGSIHIGGLNLGGVTVPIGPVQIAVLGTGLGSVEYENVQTKYTDKKKRAGIQLDNFLRITLRLWYILYTYLVSCQGKIKQHPHICPFRIKQHPAAG